MKKIKNIIMKGLMYNEKELVIIFEFDVYNVYGWM